MGARAAAACSALVLRNNERSGTSEGVRRVYPEMDLYTTVPPHHCSVFLQFEGCGLRRGKKRSFTATPRMLEAFQETAELRSKTG